MLDSVALTPYEGAVLVEGGVTDVARRLVEGDGILGWEGDPNARLMVDTASGLYDVWSLDEQGQPMIVVGQRPYCDQRLIEDVIRSDTRRFDVIGRIDAKNRRRHELERTAQREKIVELADKFHHALLHDLGSHVGGLTRRVY